MGTKPLMAFLFQHYNKSTICIEISVILTQVGNIVVMIIVTVHSHLAHLKLLKIENSDESERK